MRTRTIGLYLLLTTALLATAARAEEAPLALPIPPPRRFAVAALPPPPPRPVEASPLARLIPEDLERIALERNPTIAQAVDRFEQARGRAFQAGAYPNPLIIWSAPDLGEQGTAGQQQALFQQPVVTGGKLRLNRARLEVDVESHRWLVVEQQMLVRNGVRMRCLQVLAQQDLLRLGKELTARADEVVRTTRENVESGHASEADLLTAENEAAEEARSLEVLAERYLNSWRELAAYLGDPDMRPVEIDGGLGGEMREFSWEPTLDRLLRESPELRVAELIVRRQELSLERERREPIPDLVVRLGTTHDPNNGRTTGYARLYADLPLWDRNRGNIYAAERALLELRRDVDRVRLNLQQRLARDFNHHRTGLVNLRRFGDGILPRARRAFEIYLEEFAAEQANYSRVQSSRSAYAEASVKYIEELLELRRAEVAIDGLQLVEEAVEVGTLRPPGSGRLQPPGEGSVVNTPPGGGVPVGRPYRGNSG
ncbi:TolC family protein [Paludisphaera sp.]|uniref:TolC family protein n=1 Tax=Paludisphaera sp. TaxID=2017432 RepID=UPI00301E092A